MLAPLTLLACVSSTRIATFSWKWPFRLRRMITAPAEPFCCPPFGSSLLLPCCGDRAWYLRHSRLIRELLSKKLENSTHLICFFGGSQTSLCCGDRALGTIKLKINSQRSKTKPKSKSKIKINIKTKIINQKRQHITFLMERVFDICSAVVGFLHKACEMVS